MIRKVLISGFLDHTRMTNWLPLLHCLFSFLFYPFTPKREVNSQLLVFEEHLWKKKITSNLKNSLDWKQLLGPRKIYTFGGSLGMVQFISPSEYQSSAQRYVLLIPLVFPLTHLPPTQEHSRRKLFSCPLLFTTTKFSFQVTKKHISTSLGPILQHMYVFNFLS